LVGHDPFVLQLKRAFKNQGQGHNGAQNQGPDGPTGRLYDGQQKNTVLFLSHCQAGIIGEWRCLVRPSAHFLLNTPFSVDNFVKNFVFMPIFNTPVYKIIIKFLLVFLKYSNKSMTYEIYSFVAQRTLRANHDRLGLWSTFPHRA